MKKKNENNNNNIINKSSKSSLALVGCFVECVGLLLDSLAWLCVHHHLGCEAAVSVCGRATVVGAEHSATKHSQQQQPSSSPPAIALAVASFYRYSKSATTSSL